MKTEKQIRQHIDNWYKELRRIERDVPPGDCNWRQTKRYIEALQWVIDEE